MLATMTNAVSNEVILARIVVTVVTIVLLLDRVKTIQMSFLLLFVIALAS